MRINKYFPVVFIYFFLPIVGYTLPIVVYFLSKIGLLTPKFMQTYRRHAVVVILILAAVITPTSDATTLMMVAIPLYVLYEISILVSAYVVKEKEKIKI